MCSHELEVWFLPDPPCVRVFVAIDGSDDVLEQMVYVGPRMGRTVDEWTEAAMEAAFSAVEQLLETIGLGDE